MPTEEDNWKFPGVTSPNTTQVPDQYLDELLPVLSGAELKVLLYITRRTFGFKKESDNISLSQMLNGIHTKDGRVFDRGVGLTKKTLLRALASLKAKNIIITRRRRSAQKGDEPTAYSLNILTWPNNSNTSPVGEKVHQGGGGKNTPPPRRKNYTTQQTVLQQTEQQQVVVDRLVELNIGAQKARALAEKYPPEYLEEKIELLEWSQTSKKVGRPITDPAAWLVRAIEKDYRPPMGFKTKAERDEAAERQRQDDEERQRHRQDLRAQELARDAERLRALHEQYGTTERELLLWADTLAEIQATTTKAAFQAWFPRSVLLSLGGGVAVIGVRSRAAKEWLESRLKGTIRQALANTGAEVNELSFVVIED